jgi:hypothetical protein
LIAASAASVSAMSTDVALTTSKLASGHWVKVHIDSDGIYALSHARLKQLGFSNPENVKVYGYGTGQFANHDTQSAPTDLPQIASKHIGDRLVFYGQGECSFTYDFSAGAFFNRIRNYYALGGTYFLSDDADSADIFTVVSAPEALSESPLTSHNAFTFHEEQAINYPQGGASFHANDIRNSAAETYTVRVLNPAEDQAKFYARSSIGYNYSSYQSYSGTSKGKDQLLFTWGDGIEHLDYSIEGTSGSQSSAYLSCMPVYLGENLTFDKAIDDATYTLTPYLKNNSYVDFGANDYWGFTYKQRNDLKGVSQMPMIFSDITSGDQFQIVGAENLQVWGVDDPASPVAYTLSADNVGEFTTTATTASLIAFDANGDLPEPTVVSANLVNQNIHGMTTPDMVIVSPSIFLTQAEELAEIHRQYQGLDVAVVEQQQVFNEFSSGVAHPMAVRRMMQMFYERNPEKIKAVLLYGAASNVQHTALTADSPYVIVAENEDDSSLLSSMNYTQNYCSDSYFAKVGAATERTATSPMYAAMLQPMVLAAGRLPINSVAQAEAYNTKARKYLSTPPVNPSPNSALFVADYASTSEDPHMADTEEMVTQLKNNCGDDVTAIRAYSNLYTLKTGQKSESTEDAKMLKKLIANSLQRGVGFMCFFGHGSNGGIGFWSMGDPQTYPYANPPMMMFGTCEGAEIDLSDQGLYTDLLFTAEGGSMGLIGSSRTVVQNYNLAFGEKYAAEYFAAPDGEMLGDSYYRAHNKIITTWYPYANVGNKYILNTFAYNFVGDPAMPIYSATRGAQLTEVNSTQTQPTDTLNPSRLVPQGLNTFAGIITDSKGNVDTSFNGNVVLTVYDCPFVAANRAGSTSDQKRFIASLTVDHEALTEIVGTVTNGQFTASGYVPTPMREGSSNRINIYATSDDRSVRARGSFTNATVQAADGDEQFTEAAAPSISDAYIETPDNNGGAPFNETTLTLYAKITAPAGLRKSSQLDNSITLRIDDVPVLGVNYAVIANADNTYDLVCDIADLGNGPHTAVLTVNDNLGQTASTEVDFSVFSVDTAEIVATAEDGTVEIAFNDDTTMDDSRLVIEDASGYTVRDEVVSSLPYRWDLKDNNGKKMPLGVYRAYVLVKSGNNHIATNKVEFVVR